MMGVMAKLLSDQLREAIEDCGESRYAISRETGVSQAVLCRFVQGSDMRGDNIDAVCGYLGLRLVSGGRKRRGGKGG